MNDVTRLSLILVEDEIIIAICLKNDLEKAGFTVLGRAATGEEAIRLVMKFKPDLVLMDIRLAGEMDGIEAARKIKAAGDTQIVFMTGYPDTESRERAGSVNPVAYLNKPIDLESLFRILTSVKL